MQPDRSVAARERTRPLEEQDANVVEDGFVVVGVASIVVACGGSNGPGSTSGGNAGPGGGAGPTSTGTHDTGGTAGTGGNAGSGGGQASCDHEGAPCCSDSSCKNGLTCAGGACQPAPPEGTGKTCSKNGDCPSGICLPVGDKNVCTTKCSGANDCVPGWNCDPLVGQPTKICQCQASEEVCDGVDNDCDGFVDQASVTDAACENALGTNFVCSGGSCTCAEGLCEGAQPPAPDGNVAPNGTGTTVFAISKLYMGDTDRTGVESATAWQAFGYNVDSKRSTSVSTDLCEPRNNAPASIVYPDGIDGRDNSYGKNLLSFLRTLAGNVSSDANASIIAGNGTHLFALDKLGSGASYNPLRARFYDGATLGSPPVLDGTDKWPVRSDSLTNENDITSAKFVFEKSYLVGNTWVGRIDTLPLTTIGVGGSFTISSVVIHHAIVTMDLDVAHESATNGTIAGVIDTTEYVDMVRQQLGALEPSLCSGPTANAMLAQVEQASDILADGTQDPTKACTGISIGLGFEAHIVKLGSITPSEPPTHACP